ncbi:Recombination protein RecR [Candidatus Syntrophocurvum alkaliphilum]|uniref:Recombination protein RecR n=1 Tax=Candidatus Syntrophocurvum alkaliphilum TaxID=2293317 RepID=A0A6I6DEU4_9FIRM|nr:recombination mediator RecR [Candidatus Syntrophocurvum alkaliphilum]QGU00596.1 Recombination protein RecR [Candidatus Syntrophocurvum alkaliphilum]
MRLARPLETLIDELVKLPTIGPKTAQRLALYILKLPEEEAKQLANAIIEARETVHPCPECGYLTDRSICLICTDNTRDESTICVAEETSDIIAIEKTGFRGKYFVLNKSFHLMDDNKLEEIKVAPLKKFLSNGKVKEVVLALNPDINGDILSRYIASLASDYGVVVTRLAHGLPVGGDIEFADELTLRRAMEGRKQF